MDGRDYRLVFNHKTIPTHSTHLLRFSMPYQNGKNKAYQKVMESGEWAEGAIIHHSLSRAQLEVNNLTETNQ